VGPSLLERRCNAGEGIDRDLTRAERLFKSWNPRTNLKVVVFEENGNRHDSNARWPCHHG